MTSKKLIILMSFIVLLAGLLKEARSQTLGLLDHQPGVDTGYTMISRGGTAYLLDTAGQVVHSWNHGTNSKHPGYLQDNGDWVAVSRGIKRYDWDGNLLWEYNNPEAHHDVAVLPNGHVLMLVWGFKTNAEAIQAGRNPAMLDGDLSPMMIYEINPAGQLVWEWHIWDHLIQDFDPSKDNYGVVEDHPELMDINYMRGASADWLHGNALDYNPQLDQILISPRFVNELWIIDHSTTNQEAAGHTGGQAGKGGDLLYRWGNPEAYRALGEQMNFGGHDAQWIKPGLPGEGNIIFFNNGGTNYGRDGDYSSIDEFIPPLNGFNYDILPHGTYGPMFLEWTYQDPDPLEFFSSFISGTQRLANGNTLIDEGAEGFLFEINSDAEIVWKYQNPIEDGGILFQGDQLPFAPASSLFRASRYATDHPAFSGRNLLPLGPIEQYLGFHTLTIQTNQPELLGYPVELTSDLGEGQRIPLISQTGDAWLFTDWSVTSGTVTIDDQFSPHTNLVMGPGDVTVQVNYISNPDWIFGNGFNQ